MPFLLDTDVVIHLRDGNAGVWKRLTELDPPFAISAVTRVELENGVYRDPASIAFRRAALDKILEALNILDFTSREIVQYRTILASAGFSRRKIIDRMTAATALHYELELITMNGTDFRDIPGLKLVEWDTP